MRSGRTPEARAVPLKQHELQRATGKVETPACVWVCVSAMNSTRPRGLVLRLDVEPEQVGTAGPGPTDPPSSPTIENFSTMPEYKRFRSQN